jgi:PAS domain S-box-containing protein
VLFRSYQADDGQQVEYGQIDVTGMYHGTMFRPDNLYLNYPVIMNDSTVGLLSSNFTLADVQSESISFRDSLLLQEAERRQSSFIWVGAATLITLTLCGLVIWLIVRTQTIRIRELKHQAERLSEADFGEPLQVLRGDELGELADVFNRMRDKLQKTTISRNYVDRVLSSMNEAVIITTPESIIRRVNTATERLLGYTEQELIGQPLDFIVDKTNGSPLESEMQSGVPKENFLATSSGQSVPVSYTGSIIAGNGSGSGDFIYAAQNITERHKAEQRIRYLARIDALTKVPNRMQFQHLLQRAIARAKRAGRSLCLAYVDIDRFKEINDTFGHLAGDTTLETVAERLRSALPDNAVIGRLAGDYVHN